MSTRDHMERLIGRQSHIRSIGISSAVSAVLVLGLWAAPHVAASPLLTRSQARPEARVEVGTDAWQVFKATNASRTRSHLANLQLNRAMSLVARRHSLAMARAGELFHTTDVSVYLDGVEWHAWGENVGYTPGDVASLQNAFMNSPPHRENILNRAFHQVAIGAVRVGGTLWVTVFFYG
ncbi:MAG: CAP domain-containing protein [Actinomycetota bacterium]